MKIALDYDGTITADSDLWRAFIVLAQARGHVVTIVTARHPTLNEYVDPDNKVLEEWADEAGVKVVYTNLKQKQDVFGADVWIDDRPDMVVGVEQVHHLVSTGILNEDLTVFHTELDSLI